MENTRLEYLKEISNYLQSEKDSTNVLPSYPLNVLIKFIFGNYNKDLNYKGKIVSKLI